MNPDSQNGNNENGSLGEFPYLHPNIFDTALAELPSNIGNAPESFENLTENSFSSTVHNPPQQHTHQNSTPSTTIQVSLPAPSSPYHTFHAQPPNAPPTTTSFVPYTSTNATTNTPAHLPTTTTNTTPSAPPTQTRRIRTQTTITRPAERRARNDLESLLPPTYRLPVGRGHGNANRAVFAGAAGYIRELEGRVRDLEREREEEGRRDGEVER